MAEKRTRSRRSAKPKDNRLYTLDVSLWSGPVTEAFARKNPAVSRAIAIRGDQTLDDLHWAIFSAFDRFDEHLYEFQFGRRPQDPKAQRYGMLLDDEREPFGEDEDLGDAAATTIGSLELKARKVFYYWFDFGDDWWHKVKVVSVQDEAPPGDYPQVTKRVGESPPQYPDWDADDEDEDAE